MQITSTALSLNVREPEASAAFLVDNFGFSVQMSADGFVSVGHPTAGIDIAYLRTGLESFRPDHMRGHDADGLLLAFVVPDADVEHDRLVRAGVTILTPIQTEPWGERFFQVADPNGVVVQPVTWLQP